MSAFLTWDNANDYRMTAWRRVQESPRDMSGKVVVVTGATGALGKATCLALYGGGATVIATGRTLAKVQTTSKMLMEESAMSSALDKKEGGSIEGMELDMGDYDSIQAFAKNLQAKYPQIDVLVNNAGVIPSKDYKESKHGLEITYQTNFASVVVLTELLIPLLMANSNSSNDARIINVSSMSHAHGANPNNWDAIPSNKETFGSYDKDYCESKWLVTAYTHHLHERFATATANANNTSSSISAVAVDPGVSPDSAMWDSVDPVRRFFVKRIFKFLTKTSDQAAACGVQAAVLPKDELQSGGYYTSGVVSPNGMRPDCRDATEWNKGAAILRGRLPEHLAKLVQDTAAAAV